MRRRVRKGLLWAVFAFSEREGQGFRGRIVRRAEDGEFPEVPWSEYRAAT